MVLDVHTRYIHVYADPATHTATVYDYVQPAKVMLVYFAKKLFGILSRIIYAQRNELDIRLSLGLTQQRMAHTNCNSC